MSELPPGYCSNFMDWKILKLETVLEDPLLNLNNVYPFFFGHKIHFYSTESKWNQFSTCVFLSQMVKESCLSKYIVDVNLDYLFHLRGSVKFSLKAKLHHFVFGHIKKLHHYFSDNFHCIGLWCLNISCDF